MRKLLKINKQHYKKVTIPEITPEELAEVEALEANVLKSKKLIAQVLGKENALERKTIVLSTSSAHPEKPAKRKARKRLVDRLGAHVPMEQWEPVVRKVVKDYCSKDNEISVEKVQSSERIDVMGQDWRIVTMGCYGGEFTVELFYEYAKGFNTKKITVEYIKLPMLAKAIKWVLDSKNIFETKGEREDDH